MTARTLASDQNPPASAVDYDPFAFATPRVLPVLPEQRDRCPDGPLALDPAYCRGFSVRLDGELSDDAMLRALYDLPVLHEALRSTFRDDGSTILIPPKVQPPVRWHDVSTFEGAARIAEAERLLSIEGGTPFDPRSGPLFRASHIRLSHRQHLLVLCVHEAICDGWSRDVMLQDLGRLYSAYVGAGPLPAPPPHGMSDYAALRESAEERKRASAAVPYWLKLLEGLPRSSAVPRTEAASHAVRPLGADTVASVRAFARANALTPFSVLYAAYSIVVARVTGASDLLTVFPAAGHAEAGMEAAVGHFAHLLPTRHRITSGQPFVDVARALSDSLLDAREHGQVGFAQVAEELSRVRPGDPVPRPAALFEHTQKFAPDKLVFAGCTVDYAPLPRASERHDLHVEAVEARDAISLHAHARARVLDPGALERFLGDLEDVLRTGCVVSGGARARAAASRSPSTALATSSHAVAVDPAPSEEPIVVTLKEGRPDRPPLLCILGVQLYVDLAEAITDGTPVIGLHCPMYYTPGRTPRPSLAQVADRYVQTILEKYPKGPYNLIGLCFGGVVAFEVARLLEVRGAQVSLVTVMDIALHPALHLNWSKRIAGLARRALTNPRVELRRVADWIAEVAGRAVVSTKTGQELLRRLGYVAPPPTPVDLPLDGDAAKSDMAAFSAAEGRINSKVLVFRAVRNDVPEWLEVDPDMGWGGKARSLRAFTIDSEHLTIVRPPHATEVATILMREMAAGEEAQPRLRTGA